MSKLDRLKALHEKTRAIIQSNASGEESLKALMEFADEMEKALPGLLRVCDNWVCLKAKDSVLMQTVLQCRSLSQEECRQILVDSEKALEELLG